MGGLGGAFEALGGCAPSKVAEEVGGHGRPTGESNPAASGRPEAGYRDRGPQRLQRQSAVPSSLPVARHSETVRAQDKGWKVGAIEEGFEGVLSVLWGTLSSSP